MTKLSKKYVIGTNVMFFEIEMYEDFINGLLNLLEDLDIEKQIENLDENADLDQLEEDLKKLKDDLDDQK